MTERQRLVVHIGPTKSGSTYLQRLLWTNVAVLADDGVYLPGRGQRDHFNIGRDLLQVPQTADHPAGEWARALDRAHREIVEAGSPTSLITDELLARATPAQIDRWYDRFAEFDVEIVYGLREFAGLVLSQWQTNVFQGRPQPLPEFLGGLRARPRHRHWRMHDPWKVLPRWSHDYEVPVHLLAVPRRGAAHDELWRRFQTIVGWHAATDTDAGPANVSLGLDEIDLLMRVQSHFDGEGRDVRRIQLLKRIAVDEVLAGVPERRPVLIPPEFQDWCRDQNAARRQLAQQPEIRFHGDLADLDDDESRFGVNSLTDSAERQRDAATEVIASLARALSEEEARTAAMRRAGRGRVAASISTGWVQDSGARVRAALKRLR